jgi:hypothetical protein
MTASLLSDVLSEEDLVALGIYEALIGSEQASLVVFVVGTITPSGAVSTLVQSFTVSAAGTITPVGDVAELSVGIEDFGGLIAPNGSLSLVIAGLSVGVSGVIIPEGDIASLIQGLFFGGSIAPVGVAIIPAFVSVAGTVTPSGSLSTQLVTPPAGGGALCSSPALNITILIGV